MLTHEEALQLLAARVDGELTPEQEATLENWLREHPEGRVLAETARRIESAGWAVYLALHNGKSKEAQLGWVGKQWGVWNREAFSRIEASPVSRELPIAQEVALRRFLGRLMRSKGSRAHIGRAGFLRCMDGQTVERFLRGWDAGLIGPR